MSDSVFSALMILGSILLMCIWSMCGSFLTEDRLKPNWMNRLFLGNVVLLFLSLLVGAGIEKRYGHESFQDFSFWYMHAGPPVWMFAILWVAILCDAWKKWLEVAKDGFGSDDSWRSVHRGCLPMNGQISPDILGRHTEISQRPLSGVVVTDDLEIGAEFDASFETDDGNDSLRAEAEIFTPIGAAADTSR